MTTITTPYKMHELCEITSSKRIYAADYKTEGIPFYRGKEISEKHRGNIDVSTELFIDRSKFEQIRAKFGAPKAGDLLLTSVGTLGSPYVVDDKEEFYFKDGNLTWFRNFKNLDSRFLYYWLLSPQGKAELKKCTIGSSQSAYTIVLLKEIEIYLLPFATQRKIAAILSAYDDLIENNLRRINILEEMAQNLYREWFVKFRYPGHQDARFIDSPLGKIPEGWEVKALGSLMAEHIGGGWGNDVEGGNHTEPAGVIRGTDIPAARFCDLSKVPFRYHKKSNLQSRRLMPGDIVFEVSGGSKGQPLGRSLYISSELLAAFNGAQVICASFCKRIKPDTEQYASEILYLSFLDAYVSGEIEQYQVQSTGISNYKWSDYIEKVSRCVPPIALQELFCELSVPLFSEIGTLGRKNTNLRSTRDLLLPRLISGEVDV